MTNRDETLSMRKQICDILATGKFTVREVADKLGVQSRAEVKKVRDALMELRQEGRVEQRFSERPEGWLKLCGLAGVKVSIQDRIWRACCLKGQKGQFTAADLLPIVGGKKNAAASRDYVRRYLRFLADQKYLLEVARRRGAPVYVVVLGKEKAPAPHWNRRREARMKLPAIDDYAGKPIPEDHPHRDLIIHTLKIICRRRSGKSCLAYPACSDCVIGPLPPPPALRKCTILDATVQAMVNEILGEMEEDMEIAAAGLHRAKEKFLDMRQDLRQLFAGDPEREAGDGKSDGQS